MNEQSKNCIEILKTDADFLASCGIIDYSLLLGEILDNPIELKQKMILESDKSQFRGIYFTPDDRPYLVGIIDPLTGFK